MQCSNISVVFVEAVKIDSKLKAFLNSIDNGEAVSACVYHLLDTYYQCHNLFAVDVVAHLHLTTNRKPRRLFSAVSVSSSCRTVLLQPRSCLFILFLLVKRSTSSGKRCFYPQERISFCIGARIYMAKSLPHDGELSCVEL